MTQDEDLMEPSDQLSQLMKQISDLEKTHNRLLQTPQPITKATVSHASCGHSRSKSPAFSMKHRQNTFKEMKRHKAV